LQEDNLTTTLSAQLSSPCMLNSKAHTRKKLKQPKTTIYKAQKGRVSDVYWRN